MVRIFRIIVVLIAVFFSGCSSGVEFFFESFMPGIDSRPPSCGWDSAVLQYREDTDLGEVGVFRYEGSCREAGRWVIRGFVNEEEPGSLRTSAMIAEPGEVEAKFVEPYWVRISSRKDRESWHQWDFVAYPDQDGQFVGRRCEELVLNDDRPRLEQCRGYNERGRWSQLALQIGEPGIFDEEAMRVLTTTDEELQQTMAYFSETWEERDDEERQRIRQGWKEVDCGRFVEAGHRVWEDYLAMTSKLWGEESMDQALRQCDEMLVQNWRVYPQNLKGRLDKPWVIKGLDREFAKTEGPLEEAGADLWLARLDYEPQPDTELVERVDELFIQQVISDESAVWQQLTRRLRADPHISATNIELISRRLVECCPDEAEFVEMMEFEYFEPVRGEFDEALVAAAADLGKLTEGLRARLESIDYMPLSALTGAQFEELLVKDFRSAAEWPTELFRNTFAEVAHRYVEIHPDEQARDELVRRLDDEGLEALRQFRQERGNFPVRIRAVTEYLQARMTNPDLAPMEEGTAQALVEQGRRLAYLRVRANGLWESKCEVVALLIDEDVSFIDGECRLPPGFEVGEDNVDRPAPHRIPTDLKYRQVAAGGAHGCAVAADSTLWCWGRGRSNVNGQEDERDRAAPFEVMPDSEIAGGWLFVDGGQEHSCAIRADATLWCWGAHGFWRHGTDGRLGVESPSSAPSILHQVEGDTELAEGWADVAAALDHSCGIRDDSTLWCWGVQGGVGKVGVPRPRGGANVHLRVYRRPQQIVADEPIAEGWVSVTTGRDHSCAIRQDSTLWCWGRGPDGALGLGEFETRHADDVHYTDHQWLPAMVEEGTDLQEGWASVSAGDEHTCAIRDDSTLWCWGKGLGQGHQSPRWRSRPKQVDAGEELPQGWVSVSAGATATCAIADDGSLWCWGRGLATGATETVVGPRQVGSSHQWEAVSVGKSHAHGLQTDASVWSWGKNRDGRLGSLEPERHTMLYQWEDADEEVSQ